MKAPILTFLYFYCYEKNEAYTKMWYRTLVKISYDKNKEA